MYPPLTSFLLVPRIPGQGRGLVPHGWISHVDAIGRLSFSFGFLIGVPNTEWHSAYGRGDPREWDVVSVGFILSYRGQLFSDIDGSSLSTALSVHVLARSPPTMSIAQSIQIGIQPMFLRNFRL